MSVGRRPLKPSARELFPVLRDRLLASRPLVTPARRAAYPEVVRATTKRRKADEEFVEHVRWHYVTKPAVFGAPTFRNVIEDGEHR